jgi:low temperature requirement protein LtrA
LSERLAMAGSRRGRLAIFAYGHTYVPLLGSVILFAAGAAEAVAHPTAHLHWGPALGIAGGVALYLAANVTLRTILGLRSRLARGSAAVLAVPTVFLGVYTTALVQMAVLAAILVAAMAVDFRTVTRGT